MLRFQEGAEPLKQLTDRLFWLSVNTCVGIPYDIVQKFMKPDARCDAVFFDVDTALVNFK